MQTGKHSLSINQFASVTSDKGLKDSPLRRGDQVLVLAFKMVAASKNDPYLQRALTVVALVKDGLVQIPDVSNDYMTYLMDPRNLEWVGEKEQADADDRLRKQYGDA